MAKFFSVIVAAVFAVFANCASAQQAYPTKPIRFIIPYPPGNSLEVLARLVGQKLTDSWGQVVIVDNRGGGNTIIGSDFLLKSPPDGHSILAVANTHVIVPLLIQTPYDPIKDFAPVATLTKSEVVLLLSPSVSVNNLREFIALAKSRPGQLNFASAGSGTVTHLTAELFNVAANVKMQHIPYKGAGPAVTDLIGGQVQLFFTTPNIVVPQVKAGKLRALAISGEGRSPALPDVPTFAEAGLTGFEVRVWQGVLAHAQTPRAIITRLSTEIGKALSTLDIKENLDNQGMAPLISSPEQFAQLIKSDQAKFANVIKTANIKIEN